MAGIVILGLGGHARVVLDIVERARLSDIVGFSTRSGLEASDFAGYPVLGGDECLAELPVDGVLVAIGDNWQRRRAADAAVAIRPGLRFVTAVHPGAHIGRDVSLGEGAVVMAGAVINSGARIGRHAIINSGACIEHDVLVEDFASVGPRAALGGDVRIGELSAVGIGACLRHGIRIGRHTVIGAGAVVTRDIGDHVVAYGIPCRVVRSRSEGDRYL